MTQHQDDLNPNYADDVPPPPAEASVMDAPRAKGRKGKALALVLTAVVIFGGGAATAAALMDPTSSEEYAALEASMTDVESKLADSSSDYERLKKDYDVMSGGMQAREADVEKREAAAAKTEEATKAAEAAVKAREVAVTGAEKTKAANTVGDGTWAVGTDIAPGNYRTAEPVGSSCYWGVYRSGSNGADILENDIPGGGHPVVTLSEGQDFKSARCGKWEKQ